MYGRISNFCISHIANIFKHINKLFYVFAYIFFWCVYTFFIHKTYLCTYTYIFLYTCNYNKRNLLMSCTAGPRHAYWKIPCHWEMHSRVKSKYTYVQNGKNSCSARGDRVFVWQLCLSAEITCTLQEDVAVPKYFGYSDLFLSHTKNDNSWRCEFFNSSFLQGIIYTIYIIETVHRNIMQHLSN